MTRPHVGSGRGMQKARCLSTGGLWTHLSGNDYLIVFPRLQQLFDLRPTFALESARMPKARRRNFAFTKRATTPMRQSRTQIESQYRNEQPPLE